MEDERFSRITTDAKFRRIKKKQQKVKIDSRFQSMFTDTKFKKESTVDARGRPVSHSTSKDLKRYYHLSSSEESSSDEDIEQEKNVSEKPKVNSKKVNVVDSKVPTDVKKKLKNLKVDYARGEQSLFSESSSDDEESEEEAEEGQGIEHKWGELDAEADTTEEATKRIAVCNMDWDRIRAVDIMVLINSFLPPGGRIENVKIYLSEFGKKRLAEEDVSGPAELRQSKLDDEDEDHEEGSKYHMEKLRQYQLNRLKYYYAVITLSDANTANKIYTECDGMEFETSSTKMDLRFIPDDMEFDEEPKEVCDKMPEMNKYQPRFFVTTALQQAKVDLTWDETDPERIEIAQKINSGKIDDVDEADLQNYLALSDDEVSEQEEDDNPDENPLEKYRALLVDIEEREKQKENEDVQMEVTWGLELEKKSQELVKKKLAEKQAKTPFEQFLNKRKEKRKEKKKLKIKDDDTSEHDSDIPSDIDMNDPYFAEEFNDSEFKQKKNKKNKLKELTDDTKDEQNGAELELLLMNEDEDNRKHFSLKKIQQQDETKHKSRKNKKKKKKDEDPDLNDDDFELNVSDPRFSAVFSSHHYNIDPSDPHYKKTSAMDKLINEKLKRRADTDIELHSKKSKEESNSRKSTELNVLVKNVKRKTEAFRKK